MPLAEKLPALSEGDRILVVLARVLPNFASQTKETLLRIVMPLRSFRQIIILIMIFFLLSFMCWNLSSR